VPKSKGRRKGNRGGARGPRHGGHGSGGRTDELDLLGDVRRALDDEHPLDLLAFVSSLLAIVDTRWTSPLERMGGAESEPSYDELIQSFFDVDQPETSALLAVIAEMDADDLMRVRIRREIESRRHLLPRWIAGLGRIEPYRAVEMVHVLGDGDDVIVGARLPSGHEVSVVVYIDHNLGTVTKDAFVVAEPIGDLVAFMRAKAGDPDTRWDDIPLADARVRISEAIHAGAITFPPYESDTWPAARPLVEWITGLLPGGGTGYQRPEWGEKALQDLTERFFTSPHAAGLDDPDSRILLDSMLWFATGYGPGDPLRWSPVAVELLLADWIPRKIIADSEHLSLAPVLLRALIGFSHDERGIRRSLTEETLAAVDRWEPDYQRAIRSARPQGPEALLSAMGMLDPDDPWARPEAHSFEEIVLDSLRRAVGGDKALRKLGDRPLRDEAFKWEGVPDDVRERVGEVLALSDRCCDEMFDVEFRTASRRFLARAAAGDPNVFRRKGRPATTAAAVCWVIGKANEVFSYYSGPIMVKDMLGHFGLVKGGVSQRAEVLLRAGGFPRQRPGEISLGSPAFLVSAHRRRIIGLRASCEAAPTPRHPG
jgi:hypothetical protein